VLAANVVKSTDWTIYC